MAKSPMAIAAVLLTLVSSWGFAAEENAPEGQQRFSLWAQLAPTYYEYTESLSEGGGTDWGEFALLLDAGARYRTPIGLTPIVRFSSLTSLEGTEDNDIGAETTDMRVLYFFDLQPGIQYPIEFGPSFTLAPTAAGDVGWFKQTRDTHSDLGNIDERVFFYGAAVGADLGFAINQEWAAGFSYRHSFLVEVTANNELAESVGLRDFSGDGQRDIVQLQVSRTLGPNWTLMFGYRFESDRIDAQDRKAVFFFPGPDIVVFEYPDNDHTLHSASVGVRFST